MSVVPCSVCKQRKPGKLATAYWAWYLTDGGRSAWKTRYCPACAQEQLLALLTRLRGAGEDSSNSACVSCSADTKGDEDPVYLTLFLPGREPEEYALLLDGACAAKLRSPLTQIGERLPDRGGVVRGPSPSTSAWDAMGLSPV